MEDQKVSKRARSSSTRSTHSFNASDAHRNLSDRWRQANDRVSDFTVPDEDRPQIYKASPSSGSAWGKPSLHLQASIDFLGELRAAIARDGK